MNLNELAKEIHRNAVDHGWWEEKRTFGDIISLCHSELSEALEEYRKGFKPDVIYFCCNQNPAINVPCVFKENELSYCPYAEVKQGDCEYRDRKPEGIPIELADCIIRILDYCAYTGIDIDKAIQIKHEYNKTRPYRHGGKAI